MRSRQPAGAAVLRPEKTEAIIAAFFAELGEKGYAGLTMDRVAERAGVGKAALYRRWPSKQEMLIDLVGPPVTRPRGSPYRALCQSATRGRRDDAPTGRRAR